MANSPSAASTATAGQLSRGLSLGLALPLVVLLGFAFVVPTAWNDETVLRFCFVNPLTTAAQAGEIIDSLL